MADWMLQPMFDLDPTPITEEPRERENWVTLRWPPQELLQEAKQQDARDITELVNRLMDSPAPQDFLWWDRKEDRHYAPVKLSVTTLAHMQQTEPHLQQEEETP